MPRRLLPGEAIEADKTIVIIEFAIIFRTRAPPMFPLALCDPLITENEPGIFCDPATVGSVVRDNAIIVMPFTSVNSALKLF